MLLAIVLIGCCCSPNDASVIEDLALLRIFDREAYEQAETLQPVNAENCRRMPQSNVSDFD